MLKRNKARNPFHDPSATNGREKFIKGGLTNTSKATQSNQFIIQLNHSSPNKHIVREKFQISNWVMIHRFKWHDKEIHQVLENCINKEEDKIKRNQTDNSLTSKQRLTHFDLDNFLHHPSRHSSVATAGGGLFSSCFEASPNHIENEEFKLKD